MLSPDNIALRKIIMRLLAEYRHDRKCVAVCTAEMRGFFHHLATAGRRFGGGAEKRLRPATIKTYRAHLVIFVKYLVAEEVLTSNSMARIDPPIVRHHQIQPFNADQIKALLAVTKDSFYPKRDKAITPLP